MNFLDFLEFILIFENFSGFLSLKNSKKGCISRAGHVDLTWRAWDTCKSHASPRRCMRHVDVARTPGGPTRAHADAWVAPTWHESDRPASDGPTGIVGPGYSIGAITHLC